jgi:hypothetical protein
VCQVETGERSQQEGSKDLMERLLNQAYRFRSLCPFQINIMMMIIIIIVRWRQESYHSRKGLKT